MNKKKKFKYVVCKPCWELHYCPYGELVENYPLVSGDIDINEIKQRYNAQVEAIRRGQMSSEDEIHTNISSMYFFAPWKWERMMEYETSDLACREFGHICPVFFEYELATETVEPRYLGRHIPRHVMLRVVKRDGYICQNCKNALDERQIEFDHIIPYSKGGPTTAENLRILCKPCNHKKMDSIADIIYNGPIRKAPKKKKPST